MTTQTIEQQRLADEEYQAAIERLRAYVLQLELAKETTDSGSLERANDLARIYADKRWMDELPAPVRTSFRGRPVEPDSRSRFAKWVKAHVNLAPSYSYFLLNAHQLAGIISTRVEENRPATAGPLRPLYKLLRDHRGDQAPAIWRRAVELADGGIPTTADVRKALADHDRALGYVVQRTADGRNFNEVRARLLREFEWVARNGTEQQVKTVLADLQAKLAELRQARAK